MLGQEGARHHVLEYGDKAIVTYTPLDKVDAETAQSVLRVVTSLRTTTCCLSVGRVLMQRSATSAGTESCDSGD